MDPRKLTQKLISPDLPGQFKLMVAGSLITSAGFTMSFPFLSLYLNTQLGIPLDRVGLLFVFHAAAGLVAQMAAGPLADRVGRKPVMMVGLFATGLAPPEARARYTSLFSLTWTIGMGVGPVAGGLVMEHLSSTWLWHACLVVGGLSALAYLPLLKMARASRTSLGPERTVQRAN
jgi:MFS family permease